MSSRAHAPTLAFMTATFAGAPALACMNAMVTPSPWTPIIEALAWVVPALLFGALAAILYRRNRVGKLPAVMIAIAPALVVSIVMSALFSIRRPMATYELPDTHHRRILLEAAIAHHKAHGSFPGGERFTYSNQAGPGGELDCELAARWTEGTMHDDPFRALNTFDESTPEGARAREVLTQLEHELKLPRSGAAQIIYSTFSRGDLQVARIQTAAGFLDEEGEIEDCFATQQLVTFDPSRGEYTISDTDELAPGSEPGYIASKPREEK